MLTNPSRCAGLTQGGWDEIEILKLGRPEERTLKLLPFTSQLVLSLPEAVSMVSGGTKVSVMEPGTLVQPHSGATNARLRIHLGISVPGGCGIAVYDAPPRTWAEGRCIAFDDSFLHDVWQNSSHAVRVLESNVTISPPGQPYG